MPLGAHKAAIMGVSGVSTADVVLIADNTSDTTDLTSVTFSSGIDSTYGEYIFKFYNIGPATDGAFLQFQVNAAGASGYDETITSAVTYQKHSEADATNWAYITDYDQANGTAYQNLITGIGNDADESAAGQLHLFNPASTTYAKHFLSNVVMYQGPAAGTSHFFVSGYINTTTAIDDINFKMSSGNFDGTIKMWGVKA